MRKLLLLLGVIALLPGCGEAMGEFSPPDGKFSILMPGTPDPSIRSLQGYKHTSYVASSGDLTYSIGYADIPLEGPYNLSRGVQGVAVTQEGKVLSDKACSFAGGHGREFEVKSGKPKGYVSGRLIIINGRYFRIMVMGETARLSNPDVQTYLQSFKQIKKQIRVGAK
jgi:hypothetical protein